MWNGNTTPAMDIVMSFPGRPPMSLPGMPLPPGMIPPPPPYGMHPIPGMMPVPPGLTMVPPPMMGPVTVVTTNSIAIPNRPPVMSTPIIIKKPPISQPSLIPHPPMIQNYQKQRYEGPPITVFVGNISDRGSDILIRQILQKCGMVNSWKRVQGANGKLQAFGFCEYADPDSALRAIRLLHEWELGDRKLVVKVDAKTNSLLDQYKEKRKKETSEKDVEEANKTGDDNAKGAIDGLMKECFIDLSKPVVKAPPPEVHSPAPTPKPPSEPTFGGQTRHNNPNLDDIEVDDEKKDLIHREIGKFREFCQKDAETKDRQKDVTRERRERDYERERRDRDLSNPRDYDRSSRHDSYNKRSRSRSVERERDRDRDSYTSRDRDRNRDRNRDDRNYSRDTRERSEKVKGSDDEDDKERRWQERKLREKETSYQERLRNWETRERKKMRDHEKEKEKENDKKKEEAKEARRLKEFLEDYDDERDDPNYYRGSALGRRMKDRDREIESDNRDRQKEKDEIDELRRRLTDEGHPDPIAEIRRRQQEEEERMREKLKAESEKKTHKSYKIKRPSPSPPPPEPAREEFSSIRASNVVKSSHIVPDPVIDEVDYNTNSLSGFSDTVTSTNKEEPKSKPIGFTGLKLGNSSPTQTNPSLQENGRPPKRKKMSIGEIFNSQDEENEDSGSRKRKLVPLEYTEEEMKAVGQQSTSPNTPGSNSNTEEKRKNIKNLIEKIPTAKDELFEYSIDRSLVDNSLMEKRIKPWVNKKIIEYIGEEEPTLVEFICSKVMAGSAPKSILDDVSMVLDDEAEVFVVKMWRLLIYEIEAKKLGIGK